MKEPVDHILRPRLPWRPAEGAITECGLNAASVKTLTREQFFQRLKEYGEQRTALMTCMTCSHTATRWPTWQDEPRLAMEREISWEGAQWRQYRGKVYETERNGHVLKDELQAIEALIAAHPDEFAQLLSGIDARRQWLERKARNERAQ